MRPLSPELLGIAITTAVTALAGMFHMGMWRERVDNVKRGFTLEVKNLRDNQNQHFARFEAWMRRIDAQLSAINQWHARSERWQGGVESTLQAHEQRLEQVEHAVMNGAAPRVAT